MKAGLVLIALMSALHCSRALAVSPEEFKKIQDETERFEIIQQAPDAEKEELKRIDDHLKMVKLHGGEASFRRDKEFGVVNARGLGWLEMLFRVEVNLWEQYVGSIVESNAKAGLPEGKQVSERKRLGEHFDAKRHQAMVVQDLLFRTAASPAAIQLSQTARQLGEKLTDQFGLNGWDGVSPRKPPITKVQLDAVDKQVDQIFAELKSLPELTPEQVEKEYDQYPESKMYFTGPSSK